MGHVQSLIRVFNYSLVLWIQGRHHGVERLAHGGLDILHTLSYGIDGLVDGERERVPVDEVEALHTGQHIKRAIDGQRHHRQLQFVGEGEGTFLEVGHSRASS